MYVMEITKANAALLSNYEVMKHLQKLKDNRKKENHQGQLATITYETLRYLEGTPCNDQTTENIATCIKSLEVFSLTKNEKLMLVNSPPTTALEIQLMIEESEERLSEEQVNQLLDIITTHFPHVQKNTSNEAGEQEN